MCDFQNPLGKAFHKIPQNTHWLPPGIAIPFLQVSVIMVVQTFLGLPENSNILNIEQLQKLTSFAHVTRNCNKLNIYKQ